MFDFLFKNKENEAEGKSVTSTVSAEITQDKSGIALQLRLNGSAMHFLIVAATIFKRISNDTGIPVDLVISYAMAKVSEDREIKEEKQDEKDKN